MSYHDRYAFWILIDSTILTDERTFSSTQSASFISKTDFFKASMISSNRVRKLLGTRQVQANAAAVLTCKRCKTHNLFADIAGKVLPHQKGELAGGARAIALGRAFYSR